MVDLPYPANVLEMYCVQSLCGNKILSLKKTAPHHELLEYVDNITSRRTTPYSIIPGNRVVINPEKEKEFFSRFSADGDRTSEFRKFASELEEALESEKLRIYHNIPSKF